MVTGVTLAFVPAVDRAVAVETGTGSSRTWEWLLSLPACAVAPYLSVTSFSWSPATGTQTQR